MTIQHVARVFESTGFTSAAQKLVLLELAYRADRKGIIRHSQSEIAADSGLSRRTVAGWFTAFEQAGLLSREGHGRYRLILAAFDEDIAPMLQPVQTLKTRPGAEAELERLQRIAQPHQGIAYTPDGWPVLQTLSDYA